MAPRPDTKKNILRVYSLLTVIPAGENPSIENTLCSQDILKLDPSLNLSIVNKSLKLIWKCNGSDKRHFVNVDQGQSSASPKPSGYYFKINNLDMVALLDWLPSKIWNKLDLLNPTVQFVIPDKPQRLRPFSQEIEKAEAPRLSVVESKDDQIVRWKKDYNAEHDDNIAKTNTIHKLHASRDDFRGVLRRYDGHIIEELTEMRIEYDALGKRIYAVEQLQADFAPLLDGFLGETRKVKTKNIA